MDENADLLESILKTLEKLIVQANEATISAHSIRMAIAEVDPEMTVRIREQYQRLEKSTGPTVEQVTALIRGMILTLKIDSTKGVN
jgi:hypothetical protein